MCEKKKKPNCKKARENLEKSISKGNKKLCEVADLLFPIFKLAKIYRDEPN